MDRLNRDERFIVGTVFYIYFLLGTYALAIGTMIPLMREDYGLSYEASGFLMSANSTGSLIMGLIASYTAILFGLKKAYAGQHAFIIIGLIILTVTGNFGFLMAGMILIGLARGSAGNYSMQIVNDLTRSNTGTMTLLTVFYAAGACLVPFFVLFCKDILGSWKYACFGIAIASVIGILLTARMKIESGGNKSIETKHGDLSFFRKKKYRIPLILLFLYLGVEISVMGWIVTYCMEAYNTSHQFASAMATVLWVSILTGRIICSVFANRMKKSALILFLSTGLVIFMIMFVTGKATALLIVATVGIGLFMSGYYSTVIADAGRFFSEYKLAFGYFVMLSGLGSVIMPSIVGIVAERSDIRTGMRTLIVLTAVLIITAWWNVLTDKKTEKA